jgi:hypothetical protein
LRFHTTIVHSKQHQQPLHLTKPKAFHIQKKGCKECVAACIALIAPPVDNHYRLALVLAWGSLIFLLKQATVCRHAFMFCYQHLLLLLLLL